jgi:isoquinoline 1-oxidoreductase beta subunit
MLELCKEDRFVGGQRPAWGGTTWTFHTARARGVIEHVMRMAGWDIGPRPQGDGRGLGFGFYFSHMGYVAEIADVSVAGSDITVNKIWAAADVGRQIINPRGAEAQVTGAIIDALAQAMDQQITFTDGIVAERNFDTYPLGRIDVTPEIEVDWVKSDNPPTGLGEPAMPPAIPAITNAIYAATGKRVRDLPIKG